MKTPRSRTRGFTKGTSRRDYEGDFLKIFLRGISQKDLAEGFSDGFLRGISERIFSEGFSEGLGEVDDEEEEDGTAIKTEDHSQGLGNYIEMLGPAIKILS